MTDQQALTEYAQQNDAQAFRHLVKVYERLVYSAARRQLANPHDIDDVVQQTFLDLAHSCHAIREDVGSWLYTTALHNAADLIRKDYTRRRHEALATPPTPADPHEHILTGEEWQVLCPKIDDAILALPPDQRTLIIQHFFQDRSQRDMAHDLGVAHTTVQHRIKAAIEFLRQSLRSAGHLPAAPALVGTLHALAQSPVPAPLSAHLTKIGLAGTGVKPVVAAKSAPWLTGKVAAATVALVALTGLAGFLVQTAINLMAPRAAPSPLLPIPDAYGFRTEDAFLIADTLHPAMIQDKTGTLYVASGDVSGGGIVRAKLAGKDNWATIFEAPKSKFNSLSLMANGDLFLSGWGPTVFRQPAGQSKFQLAASDPLEAMIGNSTAVAPDGSIYVAGCDKGSGRWLVRKQLNGSGDFFTVDDFVLDPALPPLKEGTRASAFGVMIVPGAGPSAGIYVFGWGGEGVGSDGDFKRRHWLVRRSKDGGKSWITVDDQSSSHGNYHAVANAARADSAGNIYVVGESDGHVWTVRRSPTGDPGTWSTIDQFLPGGYGSTCNSITTDTAGNVYAGGEAFAPPSNHAVIRTNAGGTWHTIEDYFLPSEPPVAEAGFKALAVDSSGRIYAMGAIRVNDSLYRIVRSSTPPVVTNKSPSALSPNMR